MQPQKGTQFNSVTINLSKVSGGSNSLSGSQTFRSARAEWSKPTVLQNSKPLNSHRSIDSKPTTLKRGIANDLSNNSNSISSIQNNHMNHFQTIAVTSNQNSLKVSSVEQKANRHLSIKGYNLNNSQQPNYSLSQKSNILKNFINSNASNPTSQSKTLQSSGSSSSLLMDSGIKNIVAMNKNAKSSSSKKDKSSFNTTNLSNSSGKVKMFNDVQNQLNMQNIKPMPSMDVQFSIAPPQSTKSASKKNAIFKTQNDKRMSKYLNHLSTNSGKQESQSPISEHLKDFLINPNMPQIIVDDQAIEDNAKDNSIDGDSHYQEDLNESVIVFKQSTEQTKIHGEEDTPSSGQLKTYNASIQSDEKMELDVLKQRKESRNQFYPVYLSQQLGNELALLNQITSSNTSSQGSSSDNDTQIIISEKKSSSSKKENKQKIKGLPDNNTVKTPSEVFQYKLKSPQTNLRLGTLFSKPVALNTGKTAPNKQAKQKGQKKQKQGKLNSILPKPPNSQNRNNNNDQNMKKHILIKSGSQDIFQTQNTVNSQDQLYELEMVNTNFMFQTQQAAPPNSQNMDSPQIIDSNQRPSNVQNLDSKKSAIIHEMESNFANDSQNIRVMARFRPLNNIEIEFNELHDKNASHDNLIHYFEDGKTLKVKEDFYSHANNLVFTFDHIFQQSTSQAELFEVVGKQTIEDIMNGYNGTIFAYGQTGSGKTFTMYGQDIFDEQLMGVVPRAARQIFNHIRTQDLEIEYQIRIQMVEIYKEQLRDLLHDSPEQPPELKIKEDPKRGTYVEGLTDVCIVSEEEIMTVLCTGETMRHVASTSLNQVSSRSHSICVIEIIQKYPNDSEKRGLLNLVDLAGSERVSKSNAQGKALEEAKKINYSLSMLGKVINSLTKSAQYIPYRDSKLTRLLKESLGGNNKTSLIVACSPHHSNIEETVSSLRFAQSAKFIQNKIKMNVKSSPEHLQIIISQLKLELQTAKDEILRLRLISTSTNSNQLIPGQCQALEYSNNEDLVFAPEKITESEMNNAKQVMNQVHLNFNNVLSAEIKPIEPILALHNRPHQSLLAKNYDVIETNNQRMQMLSLLSSEFSSIPGTGTPNFISPVKNYEMKLMQLINRNEDLEMKLKSKDKDIESLKNQKEELHQKCIGFEDKIINYKQKMLVLEKKVAEYEGDKDFTNAYEVKQTYKLDHYESQIEVLTQQVKCLEKALEDSENNIHILLKDKQQMYQKNIKEFLQETIKIMRIPVSEALDSIINKTKDINMMHSFITQLDLEKDYDQQEKLILNSGSMISLKDQDLLGQNLYSLELVSGVEDSSIPPEITIYVLKHLLIESSLANHNLQRILSVNRWRQVIEFGKFKVKSELCKIQENTINTLEDILDKTRKTHDKLRQRVDKLENHLYDNRNYYGDIVLLTEGNNQPVQSFTKETLKDIQKFNSLKDKTNNIISATNINNNNNQSIILNGTYQNQQSQKTRFIKTITNKTLGKAFNFIERSPLSRASLGPNQSVLSQYYGQKHNPNYQKTSTPLRTGGMNSPVFYNFQSPIRRTNTFNYKMNQPQIIQQQIAGNENATFANQKTETAVVGPNGEQLTFEDAIVKFFNSNENEERLLQRCKDSAEQANNSNMYFLTLDDLSKIEQLQNLQEVKDFIKSKFERQSLLERALNQHDPSSHSSATPIGHNIHNPLFVQYQNNAVCHSNTQSNLQFASENGNPQINSHTTNNNLYAQSNDFYDNNMASSSAKRVPCSTSGNQYDHQRQEHVMTLASDYMITSNSVIGPCGLFSNGPQCQIGGNNQYYQNEYMDRLQEKIVQLQEEVETQKCRAEEHKKAYYESKRQIESMREMTEEREMKFKNIMKNEVYQWEHALNKVKEMNELELQKKQREIESLHQLLAQWIESYQELEKNKGIKPLELEKLLVETLRHKRNRSSGGGCRSDIAIGIKQSNNIMKQQQVLKERQSAGIYIQTGAPKKVKQGGSSNVLCSVLHDNPILYGTQSSMGMSAGMTQKDSTFENKKHIQGDNSPVQQEESYLDLDSSVRTNNNQNSL